MSKVYLRQININKNFVSINLNENVKKHILQLSPNEAKLSYNAWMLLKEVLKNEFDINMDKLHIAYNNYGKPYFLDCNIKFNLSHDEDIVGVFIANNDVGIDILKIKPIKNLKTMIKKLNLNANATEEEALVTFSKLEAHYKKIGTGIYASYLSSAITIPLVQKIVINNQTYIISLDFDNQIDNIEFIKWY